MLFSKGLDLPNEVHKNIVLCKKYACSLMNVTFDRQDILKWFRSLCLSLTRIIGSIGEYYKANSSNSDHSTLFLYLTQTLTSLALLINIFVREEKEKLRLVQARRCVIKQLTCCLESVEASLNSEKLLDDQCGNFVKWMDIALEKLMEMHRHKSQHKLIETYRETRNVFEEVLSHAMSIAQVSLSEDSKSIRGGCQVVLSILDCLHKEIKNSSMNRAMVNLLIDACSDKLCILETKVNSAVLRLCLHTFTQFFKPLERIRHFCSKPHNKIKIDELDMLVADFDLHVDRIMQIGLFAVSCSSNSASVIKIRSCLASLEALESELVPIMTSSLMDNSHHNINCSDVLMNHWMNQADCLQQLIYLIIDPSTFCQVIYEEASSTLDNLSESLKKNNMIKQDELNGFISVANVMQIFFNKARTEFSASEIMKIDKELEDFTKVLEEVESASKSLLSEGNISHENCKRVMKRCKILLTVLKRIWFSFGDDTISNKQVKHLNSKLETLELEPKNNAFPDYIIARGTRILQERSVLYRTPIKPAAITLDGINRTNYQQKEIPLSKHTRKLCFTNTSMRSVTNLDLQITEILNEVNNLSVALDGKNPK